MIRILLVDDQVLVRRGFRMILELEEDIEVCGEATDGAEAISMTRTEKPDVVLMDLSMPRVDGLEATRRILSRHGEEAKILVLTTFDEDDKVYAALSTGASGFLLKDVEPDDLIHAVRVVARGDAMLGSSVTRRLIDQYTRRAPVRQPVDNALSEREREVFGLLARGRSNAEIAEELFLSPATVKTHVQRLLAKLNLRDRVQAVILAYESGTIEPGGKD